MSYQKVPLGIYVDLDSILDTRMGTLMDIDPNKGLALLEQDRKHYFFREVETFKGFTNEEFLNRYKDRVKHKVHERSLITNIVKRIIELIVDFNLTKSDNPHHDRTLVYLNVYPYKLTQEEKNMLVLAMEERLLHLSQVQVIDWDNSEVNCKWLYDNVKYVFVYHYDVFLEARRIEMKHFPLMGVGLFFPMIYWERLPTDQELEFMKEFPHLAPVNLFDFISKLYQNHIEINFIPIDTWCLINEAYEEERHNSTTS